MEEGPLSMTGVTEAEGRRELLRAVFGPEGADLFVVLRNGAGLPDVMTGTDIDISTLPGLSASEVVAYLDERAAGIGWVSCFVSVRPHMTALALVGPSCATGERHAIHFDVFDGITFLCLPLVAKETLAAESVVIGGVRQLTRRGRVLATVAHHLTWSGALTKPSYLAELTEVSRDSVERQWLVDGLSAVFGPALAAELTEPRTTAGLGQRRRARRLRLGMAVVRTSWANRPAVTVARVATYVLGQLRSILSPPGAVGRLGDVVRRPALVTLDLELACAVSPHGFAVPSMKAAAACIKTRNGPRYEAILERDWRLWAPVRWTIPSAFLWLAAKRNRVVVLDRIPVALSVLAATRWRPGWLAGPA